MSKVERQQYLTETALALQRAGYEVSHTAGENLAVRLNSQPLAAQPTKHAAFERMMMEPPKARDSEKPKKPRRRKRRYPYQKNGGKN